MFGAYSFQKVLSQLNYVGPFVYPAGVHDTNRSQNIKCSVVCGSWEGVIGPSFFKDEEGTSVTVNGESYRS